jgi:simple sugar transport system ATP-binding protein
VALLDVRSISKSFGAIRALSDISFSVNAGEVVGLMGDNGAGKSTMVKLIAGNFPPTEGVVDGKACHFHKPIEARAEGIEVVYQELALADNLTAAENVFLGREIKKGFWPFRILDKQAMIGRAGVPRPFQTSAQCHPRYRYRPRNGPWRHAPARPKPFARGRELLLHPQADRQN